MDTIHDLTINNEEPKATWEIDLQEYLLATKDDGQWWDLKAKFKVIDGQVVFDYIECSRPKLDGE